MSVLLSIPVFINYSQVQDDLPDPLEFVDPIFEELFVTEQSALEYRELVDLAKTAYQESGLSIGIEVNGTARLVHHTPEKELVEAGQFNLVVFGEEPTCSTVSINRLTAFFKESLPSCGVRLEKNWMGPYTQEGGNGKQWLSERQKQKKTWAADEQKDGSQQQWSR